MLYLNLDELLALTRQELCALAERIEASLPMFEPGSIGRYNALISLANIRRAMRLRGYYL